LEERVQTKGKRLKMTILITEPPTYTEQEVVLRMRSQFDDPARSRFMKFVDSLGRRYPNDGFSVRIQATLVTIKSKNGPASLKRAVDFLEFEVVPTKLKRVA
jgi:hypothetical protein